MKLTRAVALGAAALGAVAVRDATQKRHAILRNYPLIGHLRFQLERFGPELRQYIVTSNDEERPFSRDQRRWIYASSKLENAYFGFGTDNDVENARRVTRSSGTAPSPERVPPPGATPRRACRSRPPRSWAGRAVVGTALRPPSVVNISGMSFGSLSANAIEALNRGAALAGCLQNTGEGGLSAYHRNGGDLVLQIGTSYFGCRDADGSFDLARLKDLVASAPVRALEIKLSPRREARPRWDAAGARRCPRRSRTSGASRSATDCASPSRHQVFHDVDSHARLRRAARRRDRTAGRDQVGGRATWSSGTGWPS